MTAAEALKYAEKNGAKMVDFKFVDLLGIWQHTTMPIAKLNADVFKDGYSEGTNRASYFVDSIEGVWNSDREEGPNLGYKPAKKGGYFPVPPTDTLTDIRAEMAMTLEAVGIPVEVFHHEVATGGQCE